MLYRAELRLLRRWDSHPRHNEVLLIYGTRFPFWRPAVRVDYRHIPYFLAGQKFAKGLFLLYQLSYISGLNADRHGGARTRDLGVTCEVTLCYGTCYTVLYNSRRAHVLRERNPLFNQQGDNQNGTNWRVLFTPHL